MKIKKGISLIVLVITIIVIVILAGIIIISMNKNNPISTANEAVFKSDIDNFQSELSMYHTNNYTKLLGQYEEDKLQADNTKVEYAGVAKIDTDGKTIKDVITGLGSKKYENEFEVINGKLAYKGTDTTKQQWSLDSGILVDNDKTNVTIATSSVLPIKQTGSIEYTIDVYSNIGIKDIGDIINSIKVIDKDSNEVTATVAVGQIKSLTNEKQIPVIIQGTGLTDGEYKVKLLAGAVQNNANLKNVDTVSINLFTVDSTAPVDPSIVSNPTLWINKDVTATITYPLDSIRNEYSYDGTNWQTYTSELTISDNCTIYARATDVAGNISGQATLSITNIDKEAPNVSFSPNGQNNVKKAETIVSVTDNSNEFLSLQYIWTPDVTEPTSGWTTFENNIKLSKDTVTANYYLWIRATDAAGNIATVKSEAFGIDNTAPIAPSIVPSTVNWTNQNITSTITYQSDSVKNEYSYDGTNWTNYTAALIITNNCTIYARATDDAGNISSQSTLSITNIDKTAPSAPTVNLNGYTSGNWTNANVTVGLSSTDAQSGILKYQYSYDSINWADIASSYTISTDCNCYITYRTIDNSGNASLAAATNIIRVDKTGPSYTNYEIKNVSSTGYDVYVYGLSDNGSGVQIVRFPTISSTSGWIWQDGTNLGNGTWYFRVNIANYGNSTGQYQTHLYMYDNIGNYTFVPTTGAIVGLYTATSGDTYSLNLSDGTNGATQSIDEYGNIFLNTSTTGVMSYAGFIINFKTPISVPPQSSQSQITVEIVGTSSTVIGSGTKGSDTFLTVNPIENLGGIGLYGGSYSLNGWPTSDICFVKNPWYSYNTTQQLSSINIQIEHHGDDGNTGFGLTLKRGAQIKILTTSGWYVVTL